MKKENAYLNKTLQNKPRIDFLREDKQRDG
jgi:hypothetical protein